MPTFEGYSLALKTKVSFDVDEVKQVETARGTKWLVKGKYGNHKISVFTSESKWRNLLEELEKQPIIFDAEIAHIPASEVYASEELLPFPSYFSAEAIPTPDMIAPIYPQDSAEVTYEIPPKVDKLVGKKQRKCGICGVKGHNRRTCGKKNAETFTAEAPTPEDRTVSMPIHFKIFVPSTTRGNKPITKSEFQARIKETEEFLSSLFGGKTTVHASGSYQMEDGEWVNEEVALVETYASTKDYEKKQKQLEKYIESKLEDWQQESIGYIFDDESFNLFSAEDEDSPVEEFDYEAIEVIEAPEPLVNITSYIIPKKIYYEMMDLIPDTINVEETLDGTSMMLGFFDFDAPFISSLSNLPPLEDPQYQYQKKLFAAEEIPSTQGHSGELMSRSQFMRNIDRYHDAEEITQLTDGNVVVKGAEAKSNRDLFCDICGKPSINTWEERGRTKRLCKSCYIMHFNRAEEFEADDRDKKRLKPERAAAVASVMDDALFDDVLLAAEDWTPTEEDLNFIQSVAYQNALEHGDAKVGSVMSRMPQRFNMGEVGRYLARYAAAAVQQANSLLQESGKDAVTEALIEIDPSMMERLAPKEKVTKIREFPDLPNVTPGNFRVRFAPNPNAPLTLGHMRGVLINHYYADKYDGDFVLRFDDTSTDVKPPLPEAYEMIPEDVEWLTGERPTEIVKASDRLELYYDKAHDLISLGGAYICTCSGPDFKALKDAGKPCPHRNRPVEENLELFDDLVEGKYKPGEAILRAKTDLGAPNPALRDFGLFRVQTNPHPLTGDKYKCWPLLDFQSAIDDHELDITHIIRGVDLMDSTRKQKLLYDIFGWEYPEVSYWGRVKVFDEEGNEIRFSSSAYAKGIESGEYEGWDDPTMFTVRGMKSRGYLPEALLNWWLEFGLTQKTISVPMTTLNTLNRRAIAQSKEMDAESFSAEVIACDYCEKTGGGLYSTVSLYKCKEGCDVCSECLGDNAYNEIQPYMEECCYEHFKKKQPKYAESFDAESFEAQEDGNNCDDCGGFLRDCIGHTDGEPCNQVGVETRLCSKCEDDKRCSSCRRIYDYYGGDDPFCNVCHQMVPFNPVANVGENHKRWCKWDAGMGQTAGSCETCWSEPWMWSNDLGYVHFEKDSPHYDSDYERMCLHCMEEDYPEIYEHLVNQPANLSAETFEAPTESFVEWANREGKEHNYPSFRGWVDEEIDEHGNLTMSKWSQDEMNEDEEDPEFSPKPRTLIAVLGLGAVAAYFAPKAVRELIDSWKQK